MRSMALGLVVIVVGSALAATASQSSLHGALQIRGATIVDAPAEEPQNTHAVFVIEGSAAKTLYEAIQAKPEEDECLGDGSVRKRAGNVSCVRSAAGEEYECDFAIDLRNQKIEPGRAC